MSVSPHDIEDFRNFALGRAQVEGEQLTMGQLFDEWLLAHPTASQQDEIDAAIRQGLDDMRAGRGRDAHEVMTELRAKHGLRGQ